MNIDIRIEKLDEFDTGLSSALARDAFQKQGPELSAERFFWTYRQGYDRIAIVSAFADGVKVGQLACFFKNFIVGGTAHTAAEMVDLFVCQQYRGFKIASAIFKKMSEVMAAEGADVVFAYANEGASVLNRKFLGMEEVTRLPVRMGLFSPFRFGSTGGKITLHTDIDAIAEACIRCSGRARSGVDLSFEQLRNRLGSPVRRYLCATDGAVAILASPRVVRSVPLLLICATFGRKSDADRASVGAIVDHLCRAAGRRIFLYAGWNDAVRLSAGFAIPERLLKGAFQIQSTCLNSRRDGIGRFEMLDVDYG